MLVHIAKTNGVLFSGEADSLTAPGSEGELTVLMHHAPLVTSLKIGKVIIKKNDKPIFEHDIERGILEITPSSATILL